MISILTRLEQDGTLKKLMKGGLVSTKLLLYYNVYLEYDKYMRVNKKGTVDAVAYVSEVFNISEMTVYRIIKLLKE